MPKRQPRGQPSDTLKVEEVVQGNGGGDATGMGDPVTSPPQDVKRNGHGVPGQAGLLIGSSPKAGGDPAQVLITGSDRIEEFLPRTVFESRNELAELTTVIQAENFWEGEETDIAQIMWTTILGRIAVKGLAREQYVAVKIADEKRGMQMPFADRFKRSAENMPEKGGPQ